MGEQVYSEADMALERARAADSLQGGGEDMLEQIGQTRYLIVDDNVDFLIMSDPDLRPLIPALSHLIRTGNLDKKTIAIAKLRYEVACRMQLLCKKKPNLVSLALFNSMMNYGHGVLEDAKNGWRGRLVTEKIRTYRVNAVQQRRKRFWGLGR